MVKSEVEATNQGSEVPGRGTSRTRSSSKGKCLVKAQEGKHTQDKCRVEAQE